jgi:DNA-binding transcriptional MerR regulator
VLEPTLPVAAVARRLGIAPATLRTWDRRYGIGPVGRINGRHRRYGPADIARLELMQRALLRGASPAEAAEYALRVSAVPDHQTETQRGTAHRWRLPGHHHAHGSGVDTALDPEWESVIASVVGAVPDQLLPRTALATGVEQGGVRSVRAGGRLLRLVGGSPRASGLGRAALAMNAAAAQRLITEAIAEQGVVAVWDTVIRPVLTAVAGRWAQSGQYVDVEHLVHECTLAAMIRATSLVATPRNPRPVLLCCLPDEQHSLPLYVLRAALASREIGTLMLGAALPQDALTSAVRRTAPAAVVLWAQLPTHAVSAVFDRLPKARQPVRLFACGPGWTITDLPSRVEWLQSLAAAVARIDALIDWRRG